MGNFVIRDDDVSGWSSAKYLSDLYDVLLNDGFKVSFAAIPFCCETYFRGDRKKLYFVEDSIKAISENEEVCCWLNKHLQSDSIELMLHGRNHIFKVEANGEVKTLSSSVRHEFHDKVPDIIIPEFNQKLRPSIYEDYFNEGLKEFEVAFSVKPNFFVPPSNAICKSAVSAMTNVNLNLSGIIGKSLERPINMSSIYSYLYRWIYRSIKGFPPLHPLNYGSHVELVSFNFGPRSDISKIKDLMRFASTKEGMTFQLCTHYWELNDMKLREEFYQLCHYAIECGLISRKISDAAL